MSDLSQRANPSSWAALMRLALPILDQAGFLAPPGERPAWTLGGGTAIALRIAHRVSDDIDIFVGRTDLRCFTPQKNMAAARLSAEVQFPGNYLKFIRPEGEIDFLPAPIFTSPGFTAETFEGTPVALETCEEVILKKVRYRSTAFKPRDIFDLAAVAARSAELSDLLIQEAGDRLPTLLSAIRRHNQESLRKGNIRPMPGFEALLASAVTQAEAFVAGLIAAASRR